MNRTIKLLATALVHFCIATVLAQAIVASVIWLKGGLSEERWFRILAIVHDVDLATMRRQFQVASPAARQRDQSLPAQRLRSSDLVTREASFRHSLGQLMAVENAVKEELRRSDLRQIDFDSLLARQERDVLDTSLLEVQRTLEVLKARQAKEQLLRMLQDHAMDDVVTMIKAMPLEKRKQILGEFKSAAEAEKLYDILHQLREVADLPPEGTEQQRL